MINIQRVTGSIPVVPIAGVTLSVSKPYTGDKGYSVIKGANVSINPHETLPGVVQANRPIGRTVSQIVPRRAR